MLRADSYKSLETLPNRWEDSKGKTTGRPRLKSIPPTLKISSPSTDPSLLPYDSSDKAGAPVHIPNQEAPNDIGTWKASLSDTADPQYSLVEAKDPVADTYNRLIAVPSPLARQPRLSFSASRSFVSIPPGWRNSTPVAQSKKVDEPAPSTPSRHPWAPDPELTPSGLSSSYTISPHRRSWEPTSMLNTAPVQRRLSHHRGAISLDFSSSELARRNELIDYERALDIMSDASNSPRASSFPPSISGRTSPYLGEDNSDLESPPAHPQSEQSSLMAGIPSRIAVEPVDKQATNIPSPQESTSSGMLDIRGEEAASLGRDLHDVRIMMVQGGRLFSRSRETLTEFGLVPARLYR